VPLDPAVVGVFAGLTKDTYYTFRAKSIATAFANKVSSGWSAEYSKAFTSTRPIAPNSIAQPEIFKDKIVLTWKIDENSSDHADYRDGFKKSTPMNTKVMYANIPSGPTFYNIYPNYETSETTITHVIERTNVASIKDAWKALTSLAYRV